MRTDPRADEVRGIVERVFAGYLRDERAPCGAAALAAEGRFAGRFRPLGQRRPLQSRLLQERGEDSCEIDETILVDQGRYEARTYRTQGYMAMWLVAAGIVQFYDDRGRMLATINLFESLRPERMAA